LHFDGRGGDHRHPRYDPVGKQLFGGFAFRTEFNGERVPGFEPDPCEPGSEAKINTPRRGVSQNASGSSPTRSDRASRTRSRGRTGRFSRRLFGSGRADQIKETALSPARCTL
jgi:hypothetical protein